MSEIPSSPATPEPTPEPTPATVPATPATPATPAGMTRPVNVNGIHWGNALEFTHLFRGFRLAINPAKLALALLAILLIYAAGRLFDFAWGPQVYAEELTHFVTDSPEGYRDLRSLSFKNRQALQDANNPKGYKQLKAYYQNEFTEALDRAHQRRLAAEKSTTDANSDIFDVSASSPAEVEQQARKEAAADLQKKMERLDNALGQGIFQSLLSYEMEQFNRLVDNTLSLAHIAPLTTNRAPGPTVYGSLLAREQNHGWASDTVPGCLANMTLTAPRWLFTGTGPMQWRPANADTFGGWLKMMSYRAVYLFSLALLTVFSILMLALAGASITRLSALELAGYERAPLQDVFAFTLRRLWVFVTAPLSPFVILLAIGLVLAVVSMFGAIPYIGPIIIGLTFFGFMGVAFVLMLLLLGILGGFNLLYPTIAIEGADSFDAMSRSFAYVYARPWRTAFYTLTSLVYGVVTFLFVSFAVYLILLLTHTFVGWGMNLYGAHYGAHSGMPALDTLWSTPQFLNLMAPTNWYVLNWAEYIGALCLHFWVFLLVWGIGAYVISYYFSSHTIIYLLLRRSVDGQNLREVYLEEKK